jgi:hypothetical protein
MKIDGESEELRQNPPQSHFVHHKSHELIWDQTRDAAVGASDPSYYTASCVVQMP